MGMFSLPHSTNIVDTLKAAKCNIEIFLQTNKQLSNEYLLTAFAISMIDDVIRLLEQNPQFNIIDDELEAEIDRLCEGAFKEMNVKPLTRRVDSQFNFDLDRMKQALESTRYTVPHFGNIEEIEEWLDSL